MRTAHHPEAIQKFRRTPWRFQQTIQINDSARVPDLVSCIVQTMEVINSATVIVDQVVFDAECLTALCPANGEGLPIKRGSSLTAQNQKEASGLLIATFSDNLDFIFEPEPKPFVFYSDHDEWTTFYAHTRSNLNHIVTPIRNLGFKLIEGWEREL